jgi:hypothetical protein
MPLSKRRVILGKKYKSKKWQQYEELTSLRITLENHSTWGNNTSMTGTSQQSNLNELICPDCMQYNEVP